MNDYATTHLEWEVMREPITILKADGEKLPQGQNKIVITRDEYYMLRAVLSTERRPEFFTKVRDRHGFVEPFDITIPDFHGRHYTLESCNTKDPKQGRLYEVDLSIQGLKIRPKTETEGVWLTEWYINGPKVLEEIPGTTSSDYLRIETDDIQFLIAKVSDGFGPNWPSNISSNIGIEYREDWGRIPDENEREAIRELCSFIFGRQLLIVGHTSYDEDDNIVEEYACNPWGDDPRHRCSKPDRPPIITNGHPKADDLISQLLPPYCELRDRYRLNDALWAYWLARDMPAGIGLPIFAAGVEAMMKKWFKSEKSKSHGVYMTEDEFEEISKNEINNIKTKLRSNYSDKLNEQDCDKIVDYLEKGFHRGVTAQFKVFFDEINLAIYGNEWKAINARHDVAHGRFLLAIKPKKRRRMIQHGFAYETIIHKTLLWLMGYSGRYIDYSDGFKDKPLESKHDREGALGYCH